MVKLKNSLRRLGSSRENGLRVARRDIPRGSAKRRLSLRSLSSSELLALSFLILIALGTLGFKLIPGLFVDQPLSWVDALFTATSAICITGLSVVDIGQTLTFWGELYLLGLIQLGGLGILTLASLIISALGARPSLQADLAVGDKPATLAQFPVQQLVTDIIRFTLVFETLGAIGLWLVWSPQLGGYEAIWPAIFHSVSAFCNAGFSLNGDSLMSYANSTGTLAVISFLIICGGIGFITMEEIYRRYLVRKKSRLTRLSVQTKMVLWGTLLLLALPPFAFASFEWNRSFAELGTLDKLANSFFLAVTPRTAGFNAIDYGQAADSTNLLTMILMVIGGSPGSTAGGMKVTTFMLLGLLAWSKFRGRPVVIFSDRSIPNKSVNQATGLFVIMTALMIIGIFTLQLLDDPLGGDRRLFIRAFEVVSAINTVGLSMGITASLPDIARLQLVFIMFIGRIGPLALFAAFESRFSVRTPYRLANEDVVIG